MKGQQGYTLIEIIVVITIGAILSGVGLFNLNNLNRRQALVQNTKTIVAEIRKTKSLADAQQKPESCDTLNGYMLAINDETQTEILAVCDNQSYQYQARTTTAVLTNLRSVYFPVLQQAVEFTSDDGSGRLIVTQNGQSITINIGATGTIEYE